MTTEDRFGGIPEPGLPPGQPDIPGPAVGHRRNPAMLGLSCKSSAWAGNDNEDAHQLPESIRFLEGALFKPRLAIFPRTPLIYVASANAFQRPVCAASNVIGAGIRDLGVPRLMDLPEPSAFSSVAGSFGIVPRLVRNNPFCYARIHSCGFGGALNIRSNSQPPVAIQSRLYQSDRGRNRAT